MVDLGHWIEEKFAIPADHESNLEPTPTAGIRPASQPDSGDEE